MGEVYRNALRRVDRYKRRRDVSGKPQIARSQMQRVRYPCRRHSTLQPRENLARGNPIFRDLVVQREGPQMLLACTDAARVGAFNSNGAGRGKRGAPRSLRSRFRSRGYEGRSAGSRRYREVSKTLVDDWDVREFQMRM